MKDGFKAAALFLIIREDASEFTPNTNMDPDFSDALKIAREKGVIIVAYSFKNIYKKHSLYIKPYKRVNLTIDV
jgi:sugar fermentation stimulation protein A